MKGWSPWGDDGSVARQAERANEMGDALQLSPHSEDEENAEIHDEDGPVDGDVHHGEEGQDEGDECGSRS